MLETLKKEIQQGNLKAIEKYFEDLDRAEQTVDAGIGITLLCESVRAKQVEIVQFLLERNISPITPEIFFDTNTNSYVQGKTASESLVPDDGYDNMAAVLADAPINEALNKGCRKLCHRVIDQKNLKVLKKYVLTHEQIETELFYAIEKDQCEEKMFHAAGNAKREPDNLQLIIDYLVTQWHKSFVIGDGGSTLLNHAIAHGHLGLCKKELEKNKKYDLYHWREFLHLAISKPDIFEVILKESNLKDFKAYAANMDAFFDLVSHAIRINNEASMMILLKDLNINSDLRDKFLLKIHDVLSKQTIWRIDNPAIFRIISPAEERLREYRDGMNRQYNMQTYLGAAGIALTAFGIYAYRRTRPAAPATQEPRVYERPPASGTRGFHTMRFSRPAITVLSNNKYSHVHSLLRKILK